MLDLSALSNLTASLIVKFSNDFYPDLSLGLRSNYNFEIGPA